MFALILFFFGVSIGSFLNVLVDRLSNDESIVFPPSYCDHCKKKLKSYDLIPIISYLFLRGKCRFCKHTLSIQYPIVELLTGIVFAAVATRFSVFDFGFIPPPLYIFTFFVTLIFFASCIVVFFADLKYGIIPDTIIFPTTAIVFLWILVSGNGMFLPHLLSAIGACGFFLALFLGTKGRGMGFGDVKFAFLLGLFFGFPQTIGVLYAAFLTGAIVSIILILLRRKSMKQTIVFGPFLVFGVFLVFFFGQFFQHLWILPALFS